MLPQRKIFNLATLLVLTISPLLFCNTKKSTKYTPWQNVCGLKNFLTTKNIKLNKCFDDRIINNNLFKIKSKLFSSEPQINYFFRRIRKKLIT